MMTKDEANYSDAATLAESCSGCVNFTAPDRCKIISDSVDPMGTCDYFEPFQATEAAS